MLHGVGIWLFRAVMLVMVAAHIVATVALTLQNRAARKPYECKATIQASKSSRTMILSGLTILAFVIYHMLHFTARIGNEYNIAGPLQDHASRRRGQRSTTPG